MLTGISDPETRNLSLEEIDCLFTGPKIVMHIADADIDLETLRPHMERQAEVHRKFSVEHIDGSKELAEKAVDTPKR